MADQAKAAEWSAYLAHLYVVQANISDAQTASLDFVQKAFPELYHGHFTRFIIHSGRVGYLAAHDAFPDYIRSRFHIMKSALERIASQLPDLEFELYLGDGFTGWAEHCPAPVFAFSRHAQIDRNVILLPDPFTLSESTKLRSQVKQGNLQFPWTEKISRAFWRGSTTGDWMNSTDYLRNPRFKMVEISSQFPDEVDASFTNFHPACSPELQQYVRDRGFLGSYVSVSDHMKHKYILLIDGFASPWQRDFWAFHSNSTVLKQKSDIISWFYPLTEPGVHYLPIEHDMSDLVSRVRHIQANDREALSIAENSQRFSDVMLNDDAISRYMVEVLTTYAKLRSSKGSQS